LKKLLLLLLYFISFSTWAQYSFRARLIAEDEQSGIPGVTYKLSKENSLLKAGFSGSNGEILINDLGSGKYILRLTSVGYDSLSIPFVIKNSDLRLGKIRLKPSTVQIKDVEIKAKAERVTMKGDTTQFNADAYKLNPDASAEDLIRKMPTLEVENGTIKAQGENVKRVLIDGKEFFGEDPNVALKNLPAEIIQKIEVFDRLSDQSQFSGLDDGNTEKTINIVTKSGKSNGEFGKIYGGVGLEKEYSAGGNVNYFKSDRRLSFLGMSNNINQQNFATEDIVGALSSGSTSNRRGRQGRAGQAGSRPSGAENSSDPSNFMVANQGGITKTTAIGTNYIDKWGDKMQVSMSYFFNKMGNNSLDSSFRTTFTGNNTEQYYNENNMQSFTNLNHRINARFTYEINKRNNIIFTPNISFQGNDKLTSLTGLTYLGENDILNTLSTILSSDKIAYNLRGNLTFRHRFDKIGRTISLGTGLNTQNALGDGDLEALKKTFLPRPKTTLSDQISSDTTLKKTYSIRVDYNEPLGRKSTLNFNYSGNFTFNDANKSTFDFNELSKSYDITNNALSNSFLNEYNTNAGGIAFRYNQRRDINFTLNLNVQHASLDSKQLLPKINTTNRTFFNILPFSSLNYKISNSKSIRAFYRSSSRPPSITQLQNIVNNNNPLQLKVGNPNLDQEVSHLFTLRYNNTNAAKGTSFFTFVNAELVQNNISTSIFTASRDSIFQGLLLSRGSQLSTPINYGQTMNLRSLFTYGFPSSLLKSNINLNFGYNFLKTPTLVNQVKNLSKSHSFTSGLIVGSNISKNIDFTVSYNGAYNLINNSINAQLNSDYYSQLITGKINLLGKKGGFINIEAINTVFESIGDEFDQTFTLCNASLGHKFLKRKQAELKLTAFDIFNQNKSISRFTNESFIEDTRSLVLTRYYMIVFTYNIRNFK
jgi:hypothetical protein